MAIAPALAMIIVDEDILIQERAILTARIEFSERVCHAGVVRAAVERDAAILAVIVIVIVREIRTEDDVGHRIRLPLHAEVTIDILAAAEAVADAVVELRGFVGEERLAVGLRHSFALLVAIAHIAAHLYATLFILSPAVIPCEVHAWVSHGGDAVDAAAPTAKAAVVDIVHGSHDGKIQVVGEARQVEFPGIEEGIVAAERFICRCTTRQIDIDIPTFRHALLDG